MKTVGLIGCGAIGTVLAEAIQRKIIECDKLIVFDIDSSRAEKLKKNLNFPVVIVETFEELIKLKPTVIVEAASQQAVKEYIDKIIANKIELIVMSTGALLTLNIDTINVHIPSGAIGGLDAISSASLTEITSVVLTSRKNPEALGRNDKKEQIIYEGTAEEAAATYPRAMNVAATLALTVRPAKVKVQVISDPKVERNTHEISINWKFGDMFLQFSNQPHPDNPHTSALAAWSAIKLLQKTLNNLDRV
jgi:aspartate dehydrogenase